MRLRAITERKEIEEIIGKCRWCHLAMSDPDGNPYVIPMNFGYRDGIIYLHGGQKGKKIDILQKNSRVCINFSTDHLLRYQNEKVACSWSMRYRSVLCYGKAEFIDDPDEKTKALNIIMANYSPEAFTYNPPSIREVNVFIVRIEAFEGRSFGY
jgi:nitroimidazol reductase NimA-like FMN-containing flavoprotein (pyridoxamine 5'-phosphate oxidase superfamily)